MATTTTTTAAKAWAPDVYSYAAGDVLKDALILSASTISGDISGDQPALRVAYIRDAESADYVAEGDAIPDDEPTFDEVVLHTRKISRLASLSSEQFGQANAAEAIAQSVARDLTRKADAAFLSDTAPVAPATGSTGLLNRSGLVDGGEVAANLDTLIDLLADLEANLSVPSAIIVGTAAWAALRRLKVGGTSTNESLLGAGVSDAADQLLGLPVLRSPFIDADAGLVVDRSVIVSAVGPVRVAMSDHALFARDGVQVRATWRIAWDLTRPERCGRFTVAAG